MAGEKKELTKMAYFGIWFNQINVDMISNGSGGGLVDICEFVHTFQKIYRLYLEEYERLEKIEGLGDQFYVRLDKQTWKTKPRVHLIGETLFGRFREVIIHYDEDGEVIATGIPHDDDEKIEKLDIEPRLVKKNRDFFIRHAELINLINRIHTANTTDHLPCFVTPETIDYWIEQRMEQRNDPVWGRKRAYNYEFWHGKSGRFSFRLSDSNGDSKSDINEISGIKLVLESNIGDKPYYYIETYVDNKSGQIDYSKCNAFINGEKIIIGNSIYDQMLNRIRVKKKNTILHYYGKVWLEMYRDNLIEAQEAYKKHSAEVEQCRELLNEFQGDIEKESDKNTNPRLTLKEYVTYYYEAYQAFKKKFDETVKTKIDGYQITWEHLASFDGELGNRIANITLCSNSWNKAVTAVDRLTGVPMWVRGSDYHKSQEITIAENGDAVAVEHTEYSSRKSPEYDPFDYDKTEITPLKAKRRTLKKYLDLYQEYDKWELIVAVAQDVFGNELNITHWGNGGKSAFTIRFYPECKDKTFGTHNSVCLSLHDCNYPIYHNYAWIVFKFKNGEISIDYDESSICPNSHISVNEKELIDYLAEGIKFPVYTDREVGKIVNEQLVLTRKEGNSKE